MSKGNCLKLEIALAQLKLDVYPQGGELKVPCLLIEGAQGQVQWMYVWIGIQY